MGAIKIRLKPEYLYPASELYRLRWPKSSWLEFFISACREDGTELSWIDRQHLEYLPYHHVSFYVRMGMIVRVVIAGDLIEVNSKIQQNWFRAGNTTKCQLALREQIKVAPSRDFASASNDEFNWAIVPSRTGTGIVLGAGCSQSAVRRAMRMQLAPGSHTKQEWRQVMQRDGWKCLRCGLTKRLTKDHIVPIAKGGSNDASNLQTLCRQCNSAKGAKHIDYRAKHAAILVSAVQSTDSAMRG